MGRHGEGFPLMAKKIVVGGLASLMLSLSCIWIVIRFTGGGNLVGNLLAVGLSTVVLSLLLVVGSWVVDALRLKILASAMGGQVKFLDALKVTVMGSFMAGVTPFDTGGEPLKVYFLHRRGLSIGAATAVVALGSFLHATSRFGLWLLAVSYTHLVPEHPTALSVVQLYSDPVSPSFCKYHRSTTVKNFH